MAKGKIIFKATAKATASIKRTVRYEQRTVYAPPQISYETARPEIDTVPVQKALNDHTHQLQTAQRKLEMSSRKRSIPTGVYSQPVETLFYEFDKRRKTEENEASAMYDVFISHASEDKADFVNPLVEKLQNAGIRVWYDAIEMQWGKSLREQIDNGIRRSKFAILVLSKNFFIKKWPQRELDGILAKEAISGSAPLPIWHNITHEELYEYSPTLSGIYAYSSKDYSIDDICKAFQLLLEKVSV